MGTLKGVLHTPSNWKHQYACFLCEHCNQVHCLYLQQGEPEVVNGLNVWGYKYLNENTIELHPSYDNSKGCGWHGPFAWSIELLSQEQWELLIHPIGN